MNQKVLQITTEPIGEGQERICYLHPEDPDKIIKLQKGESNKQTRRELELYRRLLRRKGTDYSQLPRYYGKVVTNLGEGFVTDLIQDYDGGISNSLEIVPFPWLTLFFGGLADETQAGKGLCLQARKCDWLFAMKAIAVYPRVDAMQRELDSFYH